MLEIKQPTLLLVRLNQPHEIVARLHAHAFTVGSLMPQTEDSVGGRTVEKARHAAQGAVWNCNEPHPS